jgi:hypothetical protein
VPGIKSFSPPRPVLLKSIRPTLTKDISTEPHQSKCIMVNNIAYGVLYNVPMEHSAYIVDAEGNL